MYALIQEFEKFIKHAERPTDAKEFEKFKEKAGTFLYEFMEKYRLFKDPEL